MDSGWTLLQWHLKGTFIPLNHKLLVFTCQKQNPPNCHHCKVNQAHTHVP